MPADLGVRMRTLSNDLQRARVNLASGRLKPEHYGLLARELETRMKALEAEIHSRVLEHARTPKAWSGPRLN